MLNEGQFRVMTTNKCRVISCHVCIAYVQSNPYFFGFYSSVWFLFASVGVVAVLSAPRVAARLGPVCPVFFRAVRDRTLRVFVLLARMIILILCIS